MKILVSIILLHCGALMSAVGEAVIYRAEATMESPWIKASAAPPGYVSSHAVKWIEVFWPDLGIAAAIPSRDDGLWWKVDPKKRAYFFAVDSGRYRRGFEAGALTVEQLIAPHITEVRFTVAEVPGLERLIGQLAELAKEDSSSRGHSSDPNDWGVALSIVAGPSKAERGVARNRSTAPLSNAGSFVRGAAD